MAARPKLRSPQMWDADQYWLKAKIYFDRMEAARGGSSDAALFAALSLEYFARAALCSVHPALSADPQEEGAHIMFSFGLASPKLPKTIPIHAVYTRLNRISPQIFTRDHQEHAEYLTKLRNEEMHTALVPFEAFPETKWLAGYYDIVLAVLRILGRKATDLFPSSWTPRPLPIAQHAVPKWLCEEHCCRFWNLRWSMGSSQARPDTSQTRWRARLVNCAFEAPQR